MAPFVPTRVLLGRDGQRASRVSESKYFVVVSKWCFLVEVGGWGLRDITASL